MRHRRGEREPNADGERDGVSVRHAHAERLSHALRVGHAYAERLSHAVRVGHAVQVGHGGRPDADVDADVWGFSIPRMLGVEHPPTIIDEMIVPPESYGVRCISIGFFIEEDQPVMWRGPMLHKALEQFLTDVFWDEPDYLLVDLPPGTGDVSLSLASFMPRAEMYVVTTPQPAAQRACP